ncbi:hypothetical protein GJV09_11095 [Enterobacteriaceae bacterium RIT702]|nr:hypothetical protein [Enterobacteriaceae bacterium RIT702]
MLTALSCQLTTKRNFDTISAAHAAENNQNGLNTLWFLFVLEDSAQNQAHSA